MGEHMTVRDLAGLYPEMKLHDYRWSDGESPADIVEVLAAHGYRLADGDADIAGEYNDIKAYYGCRLVPLDGQASPG